MRSLRAPMRHVTISRLRPHGGYMKTLVQQLELDRIEYRRLPALLLLAMVFWFSSLSVYSISIDQEFAALQAGPLWWVSQGRWTTHFLTHYVLPQPVVPYLPHLILCGALAVSYLLLLRAHELRCDNRALFVFPLFAAFPTWYFIGEFYANLLSVSVGLLFCCTAVLIFTLMLRAYERGGMPVGTLTAAMAAAAVLLGAALGTYQSYIAAFAAMVLGSWLLEWRAGSLKLDRGFPVIRRLVWLAVVLGCSAVFYQLVSVLMRLLLSAPSDYVGGFVNLSGFLARPLSVSASIIKEAAHFYAGSSKLFGVTLSGCGVLVLLGLGSVLSSRGGGAKYLGGALLLALLCLLAPFGLHFMSGGGGTMPYRTMVAAPYAAWLMGMLALSACTGWQRKAAYAALFVGGFQLLNAHASYSGARILTLGHDRELAAAVYARIVQHAPEFDRSYRQKVDFHGAKPFSSVLPKPYSSTIGYSFFEWDGGNPVRIFYFMKLIGYDGLQLIGSEEREALQSVYAGMPVWPAADSVRRVGDTVLVKLGDEAGHKNEAHFSLIDSIPH